MYLNKFIVPQLAKCNYSRKAKIFTKQLLLGVLYYPSAMDKT